MFCREVQPISRTMQYRKVMKPMLERKRRARINRCLDELKELMVTALATDGDNVSKLEKADILELTVAHLRKLRHVQEEDKFRSGYTSCAKEVSRYLASVPGVDVCLGTELMTYLGRGLKSAPVEAPGGGYTPPPSPVDYSVCQEEEKSMVWRPW